MYFKIKGCIFVPLKMFNLNFENMATYRVQTYNQERLHDTIEYRALEKKNIFGKWKEQVTWTVMILTRGESYTEEYGDERRKLASEKIQPTIDRLIAAGHTVL